MDEKILSLLLEMQKDIGGIKKDIYNLDQRFTTLEQKVDSLDQRFTTLEQKVDSLDQRFTTLEQKVDSHDERFNSLDQKIEQQTSELKVYFDEKLRSNNVTIGEIVTQALEDTYRKIDSVEKVTASNCYELAKLKIAK